MGFQQLLRPTSPLAVRPLCRAVEALQTTVTFNFWSNLLVLTTLYDVKPNLLFLYLVRLEVTFTF